MRQNACHGTLHAARTAGVKPEVDGSARGSAIASAAAMSVEELQAVLEEVPSGVIVADRSGRPVVTNRAARRILGDFANTSRSLIDVSVEAGLRAEAALQAHQQRFRLALEASHMGTWDYDLVKRTFTEWSPEMASLTGRTVESLNAQSSMADAFLPVHPDDHQALERAIRDALER